MSKAGENAVLRAMPCLACGGRPSDIAHVRTRKASGINADWNLIPLCRKDHSAQHTIGWSKFFIKFPHVRRYLEAIGWTFKTIHGRFMMYHAEDE